jgi:serine/threonine protein kinase
MAQQGWDEVLLRRWFPADNASVERSLTEANIRDIADVLQRSSHESWSVIPRIYSVLRKIDRLDTIDAFLASDVTDMSFPFTKTTLPEALRDHSARLKFLELQHLVYNTEALNLERGIHHGHFGDSTEIPLKKIGELGKGGFGTVDRVVSTFSNRDYARKLIPRGRTFRKDKLVLQAFVKELSSLKRLSHRHLVSLVASYTDKRFVALIMSPVADCNMETLLAQSSSAHPARPFLRSFFGCLTTALGYLHDNRIRHKDIKPSNILIKHDQVYLTDFGTVLDWSELGNSTTATAPPTTPRYCAPEVMMYMERNSSSDIWSLGCVFLEMWTVVRQGEVEALRTHMMSTGTHTKEYHANPTGYLSWIEKLRHAPGPSVDTEPSTWISNMLLSTPSSRWSVHILEDNIKEASMHPTASYDYIGLCCMDLDDTSSESWSSTEHEEEGGVEGLKGPGKTADLSHLEDGLSQRTPASQPAHHNPISRGRQDLPPKRPSHDSSHHRGSLSRTKYISTNPLSQVQACAEDEAISFARELTTTEAPSDEVMAESDNYWVDSTPVWNPDKTKNIREQKGISSTSIRKALENVRKPITPSTLSKSITDHEAVSTGGPLDATKVGVEPSRIPRADRNKKWEKEERRERKFVTVDSESSSADEKARHDPRSKRHSEQSSSLTTPQPSAKEDPPRSDSALHQGRSTTHSWRPAKCPFCGKVDSRPTKRCFNCRASRKAHSQANREFAPTPWGAFVTRAKPSPKLKSHPDNDIDPEILWANSSAYVYDQRSGRAKASRDADHLREDSPHTSWKPPPQSKSRYATVERKPTEGTPARARSPREYARPSSATADNTPSDQAAVRKVSTQEEEAMRYLQLSRARLDAQQPKKKTHRRKVRTEEQPKRLSNVIQDFFGR